MPQQPSYPHVTREQGAIDLFWAALNRICETTIDSNINHLGRKIIYTLHSFTAPNAWRLLFRAPSVDGHIALNDAGGTAETGNL